MLVFGVHHWDQEEYAFVLKTQNSYQLKAERLDNDNRQHENVKKKKKRTCAARESNPGRKNGNLAWYHYTSGALHGLLSDWVKNTKMGSNWHLEIEPKIDLLPAQCSRTSTVGGNLIFSFVRTQKCGTLHDFACHPCAGAMLIFSVSFQF